MSQKQSLENYKIIKNLGAGTFGKVERNLYSVAIHLSTKAKVAIKFISKSFNPDSLSEQKVKREIKILKKFNHPNIIRLYEVIENEKYTILVMEYIRDGEFYNLLERKGKFPEDEAKKYFRQILSAVEIAHRDIKPENLLIDSDNTLKLCDFGLSNFIRDGEFLKTSCGSPNYASPEIISGERYCGTEADIWSMGVVLYAIIAGTLPFDESNIPLLFTKIKSGKFMIPHFFSHDLADLINRMLVPDPIQRITINQIKNHPWLSSTLGHYHMPLLRHNVELSSKILKKCLALENFQSISQEQAIQILKNSTKSDFSVTYNILFDLEQKLNTQKPEQLVPHIKKYTKHSSIPKISTQKYPNNWVYGLRWHSKAIILMERIFVALKENGLEWRIIDNFFLRVRPSENQDKYIRFDIKIYKFEDSYVIDFCNKSGPGLLLSEYVARIYQALNLWYPFNNN